MKFWGKRIGEAIWPDGDEAVAEFGKLPIDKPLQIDATQPVEHVTHMLMHAIGVEHAH